MIASAHKAHRANKATTRSSLKTSLLPAKRCGAPAPDPKQSVVRFTRVRVFLVYADSRTHALQISTAPRGPWLWCARFVILVKVHTRLKFQVISVGPTFLLDIHCGSDASVGRSPL